MSPKHKPLAWLSDLPKSPPMSTDARIEAGYLLRLLQSGISVSMPHSRPMPSIGKRCHELRVNDEKCTWRLIYRIDEDAVIVIDWEFKKTEATSKKMIGLCQKRLRDYDSI